MQYNVYGLKEISIYCTLQYIVIYCNVCCFNVISTQSLHHKIDWTWIIHFSFLYFYMIIQRVYSLRYCQNPFPYEMSFYQNSIKYCNMAIYCNTPKHNTQYSIDPYFFTPTLQFTGLQIPFSKIPLFCMCNLWKILKLVSMC